MVLTVLGWIAVFISGIFAFALAGMAVFVGAAVFAGVRAAQRIHKESQRG